MTDGNGKSLVTIVVPTYNRPGYLRRLCRFFASKKVTDPILILDSSNPENTALNQESVAQSGLNIRYEYFENLKDQFEKYQRGVAMVTTPYVVMCADDDFIFPDTVHACVDFLENNPDYVLCHGYYVNFEESDHIRLAYVQYKRGIISAADPLVRVCELMSDYEATMYGVHRTPVLLDALTQIQSVGLLLYLELLGAVLTLVHGKACRLPLFFNARNLDVLISHKYWHPHEIIAKSSETLFLEYGSYRDRIADFIAQREENNHTEQQIRQTLDLVHLSYLQPFLDQNIMAFITKRTIEGADGETISEEIWKKWVYSERVKPSVQAYRAKSRALSSWGQRLREWCAGKGIRIKRPWKRATKDALLQSQTVTGAARDYFLSDEFLFSPDGDGFAVSDAQVHEIIAEMNHLPLLSEITPELTP